MGWLRELTKQQRLIVLTAWMGWVFDIFDSALFSFAKKPMLTEMLGGAAAYKDHGPQIEGQIQTVFLIGWAIGGLVFGLAADKFGRTRTLIWTILLYAGCTGLIALCATPTQVGVVRFVAALGIGGEWAAGAALIAETVPNHLRARAAIFLQSAAALGPVLAALVNLVLPWKGMFLIGVLPALLCVVIRFYVPEPESSPKEKVDFWQPLARLLGRGPWRPRVLVACVIGAVGVAGAGILPFWMPNLVSAALGGKPNAELLFWATMCQHTGTLAGVIVGPLIAERWGRRRLFATFFTGAAVAMVLMNIGTMSYLRLCLMSPIVSFFAIGVSAGFVLYFPELFPSSIRATGAGIAYNVGRILSAPLPAIIGALALIYGKSVAPAVTLGAMIYLVGLMILPFAVETKGQPLPVDTK